MEGRCGGMRNYKIKLVEITLKENKVKVFSVGKEKE